MVETLNMLGAEACPSCASRANATLEIAHALRKAAEDVHIEALVPMPTLRLEGWLTPLDPVACALNDRVEPLDLSSIDDAPLEAPVAKWHGDRVDEL